jgi:hypothetical protein
MKRRVPPTVSRWRTTQAADAPTSTLFFSCKWARTEGRAPALRALRPLAPPSSPSPPRTRSPLPFPPHKRCFYPQICPEGVNPLTPPPSPIPPQALLLSLVCREGLRWRVHAPFVSSCLTKHRLSWPAYEELCTAALRGDQAALSDHLRAAHMAVRMTPRDILPCPAHDSPRRPGHPDTLLPPPPTLFCFFRTAGLSLGRSSSAAAAEAGCEAVCACVAVGIEAEDYQGEGEGGFGRGIGNGRE